MVESFSATAPALTAPHDPQREDAGVPYFYGLIGSRASSTLELMTADIAAGPRSPLSEDRRPVEFEELVPRAQELLSRSAERTIEAQELRYRAQETRRDAMRLSRFARSARESSLAHDTTRNAS
jgi:hypothetical protein